MSVSTQEASLTQGGDLGTGGQRGRGSGHGRLAGPKLEEGSQDRIWALLALGVASGQALLVQWGLLGDWGPLNPEVALMLPCFVDGNKSPRGPLRKGLGVAAFPQPLCVSWGSDPAAPFLCELPWALGRGAGFGMGMLAAPTYPTLTLTISCR